MDPEYKLLSLITLYPKYKNNIPYKILSYDGREIYNWINNVMNGKSLKDYIIQEKATDSMDNKFRKLLSGRKKIREIENNDAIINKVFSGLVDELEDKSYRESVLVTLSHAADLAKDYRTDEALELINSIDIKSIEEEESNLKLLVKSFANTKTYKTNISDIDEQGGILGGDLITIGGESGHEKTMISLHMMLEFLIANPTAKGIYFEKEMPKEVINVRAVSRNMFLDSQSIIKKIQEQDIEFMKKVEERLKDPENLLSDAMNRLVIKGPNDFSNAFDMIKEIEKHDANIWVLDYLTLLEGKYDDYNFFLKDETMRLKRSLDKKKNVGIIISQLKQTSEIEKRQNRIPESNDMEYGKILKQLSAYVFMVFKPSIYYEDEVNEEYFYLVARKSRHRNQQIIKLISDPSVCYYSEPTKSSSIIMEKWIKNYVQRKKRR